MEEFAKEEHVRELARKRKAAQRQRAKQGKEFSERPIHVQIVLTSAEYLEFCNLERQSRDPQNFRKQALMRGAKFVANTGRGRDKFRSTGQGSQAQGGIPQSEG